MIGIFILRFVFIDLLFVYVHPTLCCVTGDWTRRLQKLAVDANATSTTPLTMAISVEGPYGLPSIDLGDGVYTVYLMISGGIGINNPNLVLMTYL